MTQDVEEALARRLAAARVARHQERNVGFVVRSAGDRCAPARPAKASTPPFVLAGALALAGARVTLVLARSPIGEMRIPSIGPARLATEFEP